MKPASPSHATDVCPFEADLKALIDGELPDLQRRKIERHLAECGSCTELRVHLRQLTQEVHNMPEVVSCPESVTERVLSSLPERGPNRLRFFEYSVVRWLAAGGLAAVMAAVAFPIFSQSREAARRPAATMASRPQSIESPYLFQERAQGSAQESMKAGAPPGGAAGGEMGVPPASVSMDPSEAEAPRFDIQRKWNDSELNRANGDVYGQAGGRPAVPKVGVGTAESDVNKYVRGNEADKVLRKVAKSASLGVEVNERLETLQDRIAKKIKADEGYVESMNLSSPPSGKRTSRMALRVPVNQYENTIEYLSGLGEVTTKSLGGKDITGTWLDERKAVRDLRKKEETYAAALRNASNRADRERARRQLLNLRPILQSSEEQFAETAKLAALARIDLTLVEEPQAKIRGDLGRDLQNTTKQASAAFLTTLRVPATLLIWLAIFTPLWLPCLIAYRWATRMARRQQSSPADGV